MVLLHDEWRRTDARSGSGCPMAAQRCCPDAAPRPLQLRHVESDADRSATTARMLPRGRRHDGGCWARERALRPAWPERVFLKQQSPTQRKGGEASRSIEGAVAELFFRPECCSLSRRCCHLCRGALSGRHASPRTGRLSRVRCVRCGTARAALVTISDCCKGLPLVNYSSVNAVAARA